MHRLTKPGPLAGAACLLAAVSAIPTVARAAERSVEITAATPGREINRYYSMYAHGPTKKFYTLPDARIVVVVATGDTTPNATATIHVFPEATTPEAMAKWINNRHSDAIYPDAAEPERSIPVPADRFHATASAPLEHEVGPNGDEYDRVRVDFTIDAFEDGDVRVKASKGTLDAYLRTKDLPGRP